MKPLSHNHTPLLSIIMLALILSVAGCSPRASNLVLSPELGSQLLTQEAEAVVITLPTPAPPKFTDLTEEEVVEGLPEDFLALLEQADPSTGETLSVSTGCTACHSMDPEQQLTGPTWHNVSDHALSRPTGESPALYLYHSIVDPNAYVVDGYPPGIMPQNYPDILTQEEIADIVAYLLQQHE